MKITKILALTLVFALALTGCTRPNPEVSSVPESSVVESTPQSIAPVVDGDAYVFADALEFEVESGWRFDYDEAGTLNIQLNTTGFAYMLFVTPMEAPFLYINEEMATMALEEMTTVLGGEVTLHEVSEVAVAGETAYIIVADLKVNETMTFKMTFWMCKPESGNMAFAWIYMAMAENYDECLPQAQGLVDSIRFI